MSSNITHLLKDDSRIGEIVRFGITGGLATGIQYGMYVVFVGPVHLSTQVATMASYAVSFIFNFFLSNYFTFHSRPTAEKGVGFALSHAINMGMQVGLVSVFDSFMPARLAMLPVFAVCIPVNFLLVRFVLKSPKFQKIIDKLNLCFHLKTNSSEKRSTIEENKEHDL